MVSSNLAGYTKKSKMNLATGGPNFASFAKSSDKIANFIANLATLKKGCKKLAFRKRVHYDFALISEVVQTSNRY